MRLHCGFIVDGDESVCALFENRPRDRRGLAAFQHAHDGVQVTLDTRSHTRVRTCQEACSCFRLNDNQHRTMFTEAFGEEASHGGRQSTHTALNEHVCGERVGILIQNLQKHHRVALDDFSGHLLEGLDGCIGNQHPPLDPDRFACDANRIIIGARRPMNYRSEVEHQSLADARGVLVHKNSAPTVHPSSGKCNRDTVIAVGRTTEGNILNFSGVAAAKQFADRNIRAVSQA